MHRRRFLAYLCGAPVVGYATVRLLRSGEAFADGTAATSCQSYAYYEPLGETDPHNPDETDGTNYDIDVTGSDWICDCPDASYRQRECKHAKALRAALVKIGRN